MMPGVEWRVVLPQVQIVSFPRSGQHFTQRLLRRISGKDEYCELYKCIKDCPGLSLHHSMRVPCRAGRRLQKNHDFDLNLQVTRSFRYVVLYRRPLYSVMSLYEHGLRKSDEVPLAIPGWPAIDVQNSADAFNLFAIEKAQFWDAFIRKWLTKAQIHKYVFAVDYDALISSARSMETLTRFCLKEFDVDRMQDCIGSQINLIESGKIKRRDPDDFCYDWRPAAKLMRDVISDDAMRLARFDDVV